MARVSILLPVRDAGPWLAASVASLARQTLHDHEVIAVDDGSRDGSGDRLDDVARRDPRWSVLHTPPRGLPAALDLALAHATAPWVARHDADDLSHRERLASQWEWLQRHPDVDVLGTALRAFPDAETGHGMRRWVAWHNALREHDDIRRELLIDSPLAHGTAMIRRESLERVGGWHERGWAEDLDLWVRLFRGGARFAKLERTLYSWRQHSRSSTRTNPRYSRRLFMSLKVAALDADHLGPDRPATLVGVGESLARWRAALGPRVRYWHKLGRPQRGAAPVFEPPVVLAFMASSARQRWRIHLVERGLREMQDFIFVA